MSHNDISRLSRLIALFTQLQSKRLLTATELAEKFQVSVRTIYRDVRTLEQAGVPIFTEEGKGYSLMDGYSLPPLMFTENEANAFITAEKLVLLNKDLSLVRHYNQGITKIKAVLKTTEKEKAALLSERVAFKENTFVNVTSNLLSSIQTALTNFKVINLTYYSPNSGEITERSIEPFAVINSIGESWYLVAWCRLRKDYRLFRFDRIHEITITDITFVRHKLSLQEYLRQYRNNL